MRRKEMILRIDELNAKVERLEECIKTQDRLIDGYQKREKAVIGALDTVETSVSRRLREAEEEAERIRSGAESESKRLLTEVEMRAAELNERISNYNALLERSAADAARNAEFFSVFAKERVLPTVEAKLAAGGVTPLLEKQEREPDAAEDPKRLMQTIYEIEKRDVPKAGTVTTIDPSQNAVGYSAAEDAEDEPPAPKVRDLLGGDNKETAQDTSLEDLLNEIIQTGDIL